MHKFAPVLRPDLLGPTGEGGLRRGRIRISGVAVVICLGIGGCGNGAGNVGGAGGASGTGGAISTGGSAAAGGSGGAGTGGTAGNGASASGGAVAASGCSLFTADDAWNADISTAPVDANWTTRLQALVGAVKLHPDFGTQFGIPINTVPASQPPVPVVFDTYPGESDPGPYPVPGPAAAHLEGTSDPASCSGDCHLLAVQQGTCMLYEGFACRYASTGWHCANGARWDLKRKSFGQRPSGWTSADAAGLPIYAGLARYEEVMAGAISHALRFTVTCTSAAMVPPATHQAVPQGCAGNVNAPPMGLRVRLKASFDISGYNATAQIFLRAFKKHGLILADNGSNFFFQSETSSRWNDSELDDLKRVPASAFEAIVGP